MEDKIEKLEGVKFYQFLNELTMQIFAERHKVKLTIKEETENKKERIYKINY